MLYGVLGAALGTLAILAWWTFFSRAPWLERLGALAAGLVALVATRPLLDPSIAGGGMGALFYMLAVPVLCLALVAWAAACRGLADWPRRACLLATLALACGSFTLVRTAGITGEGGSELHWRWTETPEERLLAHSTGDATPGAAAAARQPLAPGAPEWPGFRGAERDAVVRGVRIETDWSSSPPQELWKREVGPGWSSFAVAGELLYTQEQRGDEELVACYTLSTGEPVWRHADSARFWESNAGAGPRGTPALGG